MSRILTFNRWGYYGRLGNQMFEMASLIGMAKKYGRVAATPEWKYRDYFKGEIKLVDRIPFDKIEDVGEPHFHHEWYYWWKALKDKSADTTVSISGWLQSSKYWDHCKKDIKDFFEFKEEFATPIKEKWKNVLSKPCICLGIRVGKDYVDNGNYEILPILYQISALWKHFPNWREEYNIIVFTDDFEYAKLNMDCDDERIFFAEGMSDVEQLYLGTMCTHFIIPNSTFSWWQAYLGEKEGSVVVRPSKYFKGYLLSISDDRDFWEEHWRIHDYRGEKLAYKDVTFNIPIKYDHKDRMENMQMVEEWIWRNFDTNVVVGEQDGEAFKEGSYTWVQFPTGELGSFHRTRMLNVMTLEHSETPYIINFDCDNICPTMQMMMAIDILRRGEAEMVYPYDGRVARVEREKWRGKLIEGGLDCGVFKNVIFKGTRPIDPSSVGHIVMWNKDVFLKIGGENEYFISYGPEDVERYERAEKLGVTIKRVRGMAYHIDHWRGVDSSGANRYFGRNYSELERLRKLSRDELLDEVQLWKTKSPV